MQRPAKARTRIQAEKLHAIFDAGLDVFSTRGFRGATLDEIAAAAGLSKPNLLYYVESKEAVYEGLIARQMETWIAPLDAIDPNGEPVEEIVRYVKAKLAMSRDFPRESRLFANEILNGAPRIGALIAGPLRARVNETAEVIGRWAVQGRLAPLDGRHLIFSIWATTQHYADFDVQVRGILGSDGTDHFGDAECFLVDFYRRALTPG